METTQKLINDIVKDYWEAQERLRETIGEYWYVDIKNILTKYLTTCTGIEEVAIWTREQIAYKKWYVDGQKPFIDILTRGEQLRVEPNPIIISPNQSETMQEKIVEEFSPEKFNEFKKQREMRWEDTRMMWFDWSKYMWNDKWECELRKSE